MSREYIFYPAFREDTGVIRPILYNVDKRPAYVFWRSGSFIDGDFFTEEFPMAKIDELNDEFRSVFGEEHMFKDQNGEPMTYVYKISADTLEKYASSGGLVQGYAPVEELKDYYNEEWKMDYYNEVLKYDIIPTELYAELDESKRSEYAKFCMVDDFGKEYICSHLLEILNDIYYPYEWNGEPCYLVDYSF